MKANSATSSNSPALRIVCLWFGLLTVFLAACQAASEPGGGARTGTAPGSPPTAAATVPPAVETSPTASAPTLTIPATDEASPTPALITATAPATAMAEAAAPDFPTPAGIAWQPVVEGLNQPIGIANAGDGSGRLFLLEQPGWIRIIQDRTLLLEPFLDLSEQVSCCGERGLLGLAFDPRYSENGWFYVNYSDLNGDTVIARFSVSSDPNRADPNSEVPLLNVAQPYPNHNGGAVAFGSDGYLYLGLGDGGSGGDPHGNGQSLDTLLGKVLRIDVDPDHAPAGARYAIPPDNPFAAGRGRPEIWAYGLRNPWRFSFDRLTGDFYIGDVGQNQWEEIDYLPSGSAGGANFGWNYREGRHPYQDSPPAGLEMIDPVAEYDHSQGISVTGGVVYRGQALPEWQGIYLYGDYGSGKIWGLRRSNAGTWENRLLFESGANITSFGEDEAGEVYLVSHRGTLYQLAAGESP